MCLHLLRKLIDLGCNRARVDKSNHVVRLTLGASRNAQDRGIEFGNRRARIGERQAHHLARSHINLHRGRFKSQAPDDFIDGRPGPCIVEPTPSQFTLDQELTRPRLAKGKVFNIATQQKISPRHLAALHRSLQPAPQLLANHQGQIAHHPLGANIAQLPLEIEETGTSTTALVMTFNKGFPIAIGKLEFIDINTDIVGSFTITPANLGAGRLNREIRFFKQARESQRR